LTLESSAKANGQYQNRYRFLSPQGRCYSFDSRAGGYGRGEGVAAILLKPLKAAQRYGDTIRGLIRGTAVGSDGRTSGITMPSIDSQISTIRTAYLEARLDPRETFYVEAHGEESDKQLGIQGSDWKQGPGQRLATKRKPLHSRRPFAKTDKPVRSCLSGV
jgi:acyl transferase domain-containing protein